jgi:hypothetical protein
VAYSVLIDAIHANAADIPAGTGKVAGYVTGTADIQWTAADWARFPESGHVRIDQSPGLSAWASGGADVADMENGAATQDTVIAQAKVRQAKKWFSFTYVSQGNLSSLRDAVSTAGLSGSMCYWIADWDLSEEEAAAALTDTIVAIQWASPSSNPLTVVPGGSRTLAEANVDLSVANPSWFAYDPPASLSGLVVTPSFKTYPVTSTDAITWKAA